VEETKDVTEAIQNSSLSDRDNKDMAPFSQSEVLLENTIDPRIIWQKHGKPFVKSSPINEKLASTAVDSLLNVFTEFWSRKSRKTDHSPIVSEYVFCSLCKTLPLEPITVDCGHVYCSSCIPSLDGFWHCQDCNAVTQTRGSHGVWAHVCSQAVSQNVVLNSVMGICWPGFQTSKKCRMDGNELFNAGKLAEADAKYKEGLQLTPDCHLTLSNLCRVATALGRFEEALAVTEHLLKVAPAWPKTYFRIGECLSGLMRYKESTIAYIKCYLMNPVSNHVKKILYKEFLKFLQSVFTETSSNTGSPESTASSQRLLVDESRSNPDETAAEVVGDCLRFCESPIGDVGTPRIGPFTITESMAERLHGELECTLCCQLLCHPTTTPCGHTFCMPCLERVLDHKPFCPVCRHPIPELIAIKRKAKSVVLENVIKHLFAEEYLDRTKSIEQELQDIARQGSIQQAATVPVFVCTLSFPTQLCPLHVFEPRYRLMMRRCMQSGLRQFGMCAYREDGGYVDYGTMLIIRDLNTLPDGRLMVDCIGDRRFKVLNRTMTDGYNTADVEWLKDAPLEDVEKVEAKSLNLATYNKARSWYETIPNTARRRIEDQVGKFPDFVDDLDSPNGPSWIWWIAPTIFFETHSQVNLLATSNAPDRLRLISSQIDHLVSRLHHGSCVIS